MPNSNEVTLTVQTLEGSHTDSYNVHQKLRHVVAKTLTALEIDEGGTEDWILTYNDIELSLNSSIEDANLPDGAILLLAPREGGGGHGR